MLHFNAPLGCSPHISRYFTKIYYWEGTTLNLISVKVIISRVTRRLCSASWAAFNFFWLSGFFSALSFVPIPKRTKLMKHTQTDKKWTDTFHLNLSEGVYLLLACLCILKILYDAILQNMKTKQDSSWVLMVKASFSFCPGLRQTEDHWQDLKLDGGSWGIKGLTFRPRRELNIIKILK